MARVGAPAHAARMSELLDQGPIDREELIQEIMKVIPPGVAFRKIATARAASRKRLASRKTRPGHILPMEAGDPVAVEFGRRRMASALVSEGLRAGRIDTTPFRGRLTWGPKAVYGQTERLAVVRHQQSSCHLDYEDAHFCRYWWRHVGEAHGLEQVISR